MKMDISELEEAQVLCPMKNIVANRPQCPRDETGAKCSHFFADRICDPYNLSGRDGRDRYFLHTVCNNLIIAASHKQFPEDFGEIHDGSIHGILEDGFSLR